MNFNSVLSVFSFSALLVMSILAWLLYRRWRTRAYFVVTISSVTMALLHFVFFILISYGSAAVQMKIISLLTMFPAILFTGLFQFMQSKRKQEILQLTIGTSVLTVFSIISAIGIGFFQLITPVIGIVFVGLFLYRFVYLLPRKQLFYIAGGLSVFSLLMQFIFRLTDSDLLQTMAIIGQSMFYVLICYTFFSRVVDLIQVASQQSVMDRLTGLYNKAYFIDHVRTAFNTNEKAVIIFADIDNFKNINDTQGHLVGDQILKVIGTVWNEVIQEIGIAARYGGEEMAALITDHRVDPERIAEKIRSRVEQVTKKIYPCTMSIGFARNGTEIDSAEDFIRSADDAQYAAKKSGKNRVVEFGSEAYDQFVLSQEVKVPSSQVAAAEIQVKVTYEQEKSIEKQAELIDEIKSNDLDLDQTDQEIKEELSELTILEVKEFEAIHDQENVEAQQMMEDQEPILSDELTSELPQEQPENEIPVTAKKIINPFKKKISS